MSIRANPPVLGETLPSHQAPAAYLSDSCAPSANTYRCVWWAIARVTRAAVCD